MKHAAQIILALDVDSPLKARRFTAKLLPEIKMFKVGLELFSSAGPQVVRYIKKKGGRVFLDLKFFDIPNTAAAATRQAVRMGADMLTMHVAGGSAMLKASAQAAKEEARRLKVKKPLLVGVTVLTSEQAGAQRVLALTRIALAAGLDGVVCSAREAGFLRKRIGRPFVIVTPGIRPAGSAGDDQRRTATVSDAVKAGSNFLVVGRPILKAADPIAAAKELKKWI
ncbi:MAG: orotidine-5'-phosphate decarboxylase [Candidatus Omnitrophica bacterium]|nr:orotidine-5'-phosphate decarboxylase [Candidatus Omnitrophota bacterium]